MRKFLATAAAALLLDQLTKALVRAHMEVHDSIPILGDFLRLRHVRNSGAAFGMFQGSRYLFIAISIASVIAVVYLLRSGRYRFRGSNIAFGLVMGGALGNLIDRCLIPEVTDFIDMGIGLHRWPTYNVADIGLTLGVVYLAVAFLVGGWGDRPAAAPAGEGPTAPGAVAQGGPPAPDPGPTRSDP